MKTKRIDIIETAVNVLKGKTYAGDNVSSFRLKRFSEKDLPAMVVYWKEESTAIHQKTPRKLRRDLIMVVEIKHFALEKHVEQVEELAGQVENLLHHYTLGPHIHATLKHSHIQLAKPDQDTFVFIDLTFEVPYITDAHVFVEENLFNEADIHWSLDGQQDKPEQARDRLRNIYGTDG